MKITKKQQYINGCEHDIDFLSKEITKNTLGFYWLGQYIQTSKGHKLITEIHKELLKVLSDKTYKPWSHE